MSKSEATRALSFDFNQQLAFIRFYNNLPEKSASTVRFFNHGDYYSLHGNDAFLAMEKIYHTNSVKYMGDEPKLAYACFSKNNFEKFIRDLLLVMQYRVEVYVKASQSRNNDWTLEYKGSPGNLQQFEEILFDGCSELIGGYVMGVKLSKNNLLGVSCAHIVEGIFCVSEFTDNEFFTELEAIVAQINPKECVIPLGESMELNNLKSMLERNNVLVVKTKKVDFNSENIFQDLNRLLYFAENQQRNAMCLAETKNIEAMGSLQAVIKYLNLTGDEQNFNQYNMRNMDAHRYVRLDCAAINALNLMHKSGSNMGKNDSVYGVLNCCSTPQGKRLLEKWIKQPLKDLNLLSERQDIVECLVNDSETREIICCGLNKIPDLLILAKRLCSKRANLQDCYKIYQSIDSVPSLISILRKINNKSVNAMIVNPIGDILSDLQKFQSMVEQTIDLDLVDRGEFFIKPNFDEELNDLSKQKKKLEEKLQGLLRNVANDLCFDEGKTVKLDRTDQLGYFFRVTLKEEPILRKNKSIKIIDTVKGGVRFSNNKLQDLNESYEEIKSAYEKQQKTVVSEILEVAAGYVDTLRNLNLSIAVVDVLVSFANAAVNAPNAYVRPKLLPAGSGILKLKSGRHPCLEKFDGISCIPNDVEFIKDEKVLQIITGPNMGGKSTFMRMVAVNVLMAQIGSFVACDEAEISLVDCILARVGADDCELKGMSTFMMEMVESRGIIKSATSNSLVIVDELGRGTSTYDGCGIAWAVAEYLAKELKSFSLFATHYHEITQLEEEIPTVINLHVSAIISDNTITPLYTMKEGPCDKSYGIHCAKVVQFPEDVIKFATKYQEKLEDVEGMKYIKDFDPSLKRKLIDEGNGMIAKVLEDFKGIDVANLSDDDLEAKLKKLKTDLAKQDNLYIKGLIGV